MTKTLNRSMAGATRQHESWNYMLSEMRYRDWNFGIVYGAY